MALNSASYFSNGIVGAPQTGADVNVLETHANPRFALGTKFERQDGNVYRYAYVSTATNAGSVVAPTFTDAGFTTLDNAVIDPASAVAVAGENIQVGNVGSHYIQVTQASIAANQYKGSYLTIEDGSGEGFIYRIKGNTATGNPASGDIRIELCDPIKVRVSPNTDITVVPAQMNSVVAATAATNTATCGILQATTTASLPFAWVLTAGVGAALQDGTLAAGDPLVLSRNTAGAVMQFGGGGTGFSSFIGENFVGFCIQPGATTEFATVKIALEG